MQKRFFLQAAAAAALAMGFALPAAAQQWKPSKPINLIVPWAAGGSTDQITRVTAAELASSAMVPGGELAWPAELGAGRLAQNAITNTAATFLMGGA